MIRRALIIAAVLAVLVACTKPEDPAAVSSSTTPPPPAAAPTAEQARAIAKEAYTWGFPMVDNYRVMYSYFVDKENPEYKGAWNEVHSTARVYTPADTTIQTPNSDTPYSALGADLRTEPLVLTVPPIGQDRYYSLQFIDLYTYNVDYVGSRTTGNSGGRFLLAGPGWKGGKPDGVDGVIRMDTDLAMVLYRTQLFDPDDLDNVEKIQEGYQVTPLSAFLKQAAPPPADPIDFVPPLNREQERTSPQFFDLLGFLMRYAPAVPAEQEMRNRFASLGIGPDRTFDADALDPATRDAVTAGMADAWADIDALKKNEVDTGKVSSAEFFGTAADLKGNYLYRMAGAVLGIYGNTAAEALYPNFSNDSTGAPLTGGEQVHDHLSEGAVAAGERVLVADDVRDAAEPAGGEPDRPVPRQLADAARTLAEPRRRLHRVHPARRADGGRATAQLAARTRGPVRVGDAALLAETRCAGRQLEATRPGAGHPLKPGPRRRR